MSYTEIFSFDKDGNATHAADISNAFRSGMAIWMHIEEKYLPPYLPSHAKKLGMRTAEEYENKVGHKGSRCVTISDPDAIQEIWDLADSDIISETDKICLYTTFDNCLVKKEDIPKIIKAFRDFDGETSLKEQADVLEELYDDEDCIAVGWNQTSVNCDTWINAGGYDEESDEYLPYNCIIGEDHYWLFDKLDKKDD